MMKGWIFDTYLILSCILGPPTMPGGLFSIDRDFFYGNGSYDERMDI